MPFPRLEPTILTGDRPTGPLHLGHFVGSLRTRIQLQHETQQFLFLADAQALTDNVGRHQKVADNVVEVARDYLAVDLSSVERRNRPNRRPSTPA